MAKKLSDYVGRSFVLRRTRYGALDGLTGKVVGVISVPSATGERDALEVRTTSGEFPVALMMPNQLGEEIK